LSKLSNAVPGIASRHDFSFMTATPVMVPHSIVGCAILVLPRFARLSDRREPTPSPSAGSGLSGASAWTTCSSSMSAICRRSWPNMSAISTTGARIDRWDNRRPAHREQARLIEALKLERSSRYLYWAAFITFISEPHDDIPDLILAPYRGGPSHPLRGSSQISSRMSYGG